MHPQMISTEPSSNRMSPDSGLLLPTTNPVIWRSRPTPTPTFVFALKNEADNQLKGMRLVRGALSYERLKFEIDKLLQ